MSLIKGRDIMLFVDDGDGYKPIAYGIACNIKVSTDMLDISSKHSGIWGECKAGRLNWTCSSESICGESEALRVLRTMISLKPVKISFAISEGSQDSSFNPSGKERMDGMAYITDFTTTSDNDNITSMSIEFAGTGALEPLSDYYNLGGNAFNYQLSFKLG